MNPPVFDSAARPMSSINPTTGHLLREFPLHSAADIEARLQKAGSAFRQYRRSPFAERARSMTRVAEILDAEKNAWARIMTLEMGKPLRASIQEVEKCASGCRYYAANAERFLVDEIIETPGTQSFVRYQPLGIILAVMPWNFPFWQVIRFAAPTLMAGNVALLKHASNVPQCALALEEIFLRAGFPEGVFQTLLVGSDRVSSLLEDTRVKAVSLTGSVGAGASVAGTAGKQIKKSVLELGGSDPFIIMPSANLPQAVQTAVQARTINNGQSCIAAKRFILHRHIADEFEQLFIARLSSLRIGDPLELSTDLGPLATADVLHGLEKQVAESVRMGARLLLGGHRLPQPGYFFPPTVLTDLPPRSPGRVEELFGPVAALFRVDGMEEALALANETVFGLGASLWTNDPHERDLFVDEIEAGLAFINGMVVSHPALPFGGIKQSGYGRELSSHGLREFVNIKTVSIQEKQAGDGHTE